MPKAYVFDGRRNGSKSVRETSMPSTETFNTCPTTHSGNTSKTVVVSRLVSRTVKDEANKLVRSTSVARANVSKVLTVDTNFTPSRVIVLLTCGRRTELAQPACIGAVLY